MSHFTLDIRVYTRPGCEGTMKTLSAFRDHKLNYRVIDVTKNADAHAEIVAVTGVDTAITPVVVATCSCGHHIEHWIDYSSSRCTDLIHMALYLRRAKSA